MTEGNFIFFGEEEKDENNNNEATSFRDDELGKNSITHPHKSASVGQLDSLCPSLTQSSP
jgi:hypothetical protein